MRADNMDSFDSLSLSQPSRLVSALDDIQCLHWADE